jgi:predicted O-linked N-acetylglucosamine transferase (SPINDLY family)
VASPRRPPSRAARRCASSPTWRRHTRPCCWLDPSLAAYDRTALEVTCYASIACPDAWTIRLQAQADHWRDCRTLGQAEVARQIVADGIAVLIDLIGHTAGSRLPVLARQPAPAQVSYLG